MTDKTSFEHLISGRLEALDTQMLIVMAALAKFDERLGREIIAGLRAFERRDRSTNEPDALVAPLRLRAESLQNLLDARRARD